MTSYFLLIQKLSKMSPDESIYQIDGITCEPTFVKVNGITLHVVRAG